MQILIVDDEPLARARLVRLIEQQPGIEVVAEAENGEQAVAKSNEFQPDVVLMDIRMPVMDGLEAARHLASFAQPPAVIFCTAYNDYALDAFEASAVGYLLKPVNRKKLAAALDKATKLTRVQLNTLSSEGDHAVAKRRSHIAAKSGRGIELIALADVRYFSADQKYVTVFYVVEGELKETLIDDPLKDLEEELGDQFLRIHRNALVAIEHIQGMEKSEQGATIQLAGIASGPQVSRRYLPRVREILENL